MSQYIVQMKAIEKAFHTNRVLHGVDFSLKEGSIHALLGENGTGKTTLMNILGGVLPKDAGEIYIDQEKIDMADPNIATEKGIAFIHQELTLINDLNVYENLFLGSELKRGGTLNKREMAKRAKEMMQKMDVDLNPCTMVRDLNASYKQIVEIARALMKNARVIIMDEPTASLTDVEIEHIFSLMRGLKAKGVSFVFISHKLNEVVDICDEYTVMRDGRVVAYGSMTEDITENVLARHMVGKELLYDDLYVKREVGEVILKTENLSRDKEFSDINLEIRRGEIVGVTGLLGDGRSELFATIYGCNDSYKGDIYVGGQKQVMHATPKAKKLGISYVPRNRKENGIIRDLSVAENMSISIMNRFTKCGLILRKREKKSNDQYVKDLNIKVNDLKELITSLSGGNQQKAVLAKALGPNPSLVILDNPTQGVDIGAKLEIYNIIMKLAQQGVSFVVLSSEAQEILRVCDRIYVMYHGKIKRTFSREEATEENIMVVATGGTLQEEGVEKA